MSVAETESGGVELSPADVALASRLALIVGRMRAEGRFNVEQFLMACEAGMGGTVVVKAPSDRAKRDVPEARYVSEGVEFSGALRFEAVR